MTVAQKFFYIAAMTGLIVAVIDCWRGGNRMLAVIGAGIVAFGLFALLQ